MENKKLAISSQLVKDGYLILLTLILTLLMFNLFMPFAITLLISLLLVALFQPLYKFFEKKLGSVAASALSTTLVLLMVIIPVTITLIVLINEAARFGVNLADTIRNEFINNPDQTFIDKLNQFLISIGLPFSIDASSVENFLISAASSLGQALSGSALQILQNLGSFIIQFLIFIISLAIIFKDYEKIPGAVKRLVPLDDKVEEKLFENFLSTGKSVIKGMFLVSLIHAISITLISALFGVEALSIVFICVFIASIVPGGSQIVWIPVSIIMGFILGAPMAIAMLVMCAIVMNLVDTTIRPALTGGGDSIHPLLSLISVLGGLAVFGIPGLLYGPLIAILFVTILNAFNQRFA